MDTRLLRAFLILAMFIAAIGSFTASRPAAASYPADPAAQQSDETFLSTLPDWTMQGTFSNQQKGLPSEAGDVNGDGYDDLMIGQSPFGGGDLGQEGVSLYYGSPTGLSITADWFVFNDQAASHLGERSETAGDVNGDGYDDVLVSAFQYDNGEVDEGRVYAYYGSAAGLNQNPNWTVESNNAGALMGESVSTAGDVNGDGYDDVVIGAYGYSSGETSEGAIYLYYGSASGLSSVPAKIYESGISQASLGIGVSNAGDVNKDGYSDVVAGAHGYSNGESGEGRLYLFLGSPDGWHDTPDWTFEPNTTDLYLGCNTAFIGDVNGDGYSDFSAGGNPAFLDRTYGFYGSPNGPKVNADWVVSSMGSTPNTAGDINHDGYADLITGNPWPDSAWLFYGSAAGLSITPAWVGNPDQPGSHYGWPLGSLGDVNGDGNSDIYVGAHAYPNYGRYGKTFVYYGKRAPKAWTLLFYMAADNDPPQQSRLQEEYRLLSAAAANQNVNIVALWDGIKSEARYVYFGANQEVFTNQGEVNTGDPQTLSNFITWSVNRYPASHYALIFSDHGNGIRGTAVDFEGPGVPKNDYDLLTPKEISQALAPLQKMDVIYMNACLMATVESAYQVKDVASYYVASESVTWGSIHPDWWILGNTDQGIHAITQTSTAVELALAMMKGYVDAHMDEHTPSVISVIDLAKVGAVADQSSVLGALVRANLSTLKPALDEIVSQVQRFEMDNNGEITRDDSLVDLYHFAQLLKGKTDDPAIQSAADALMTTVAEAVPAGYEYHWSGVSGNKHWDHANSHGISIFFPDPKNKRSYYDGLQFDFAAGTSWNIPAGSGMAQSSVEYQFEWGPMLVDYLYISESTPVEDPAPPRPVGVYMLYQQFLPFVKR